MSDLLQCGSEGPEVHALQQALADGGYYTGAVDGCFGPETEAAVKQFQQDEGLAEDGVAGPETMDALGLGAEDAPPSGTIAAGPADAAEEPAEETDITQSVTPTMVYQMFPGAPHANIDANLPLVLSALRDAGLGDKQMVLMALGTIRAETAGFKPISEMPYSGNTLPGGAPFSRYDNAARLGNGPAPDGADFRGRGFVQLTGRCNYTRLAQETGEDLVNDPELANDPEIAAKILAQFLSDHEAAIRAALAQNNLQQARKLVNGGSNGFADFESAYNIGDGLIP